MLLSKKKQSRRALALWLGITVFLVMLVTGIAYVMLYAEVFEVDGFNVEGNRLTGNKSAIISALAMQNIHSRRILGVLGKDRILFWFLSERDAVVNKHTLPTIEKLNVDVDLIKKNVYVAIEERKLFGVVCSLKDDCYGFDKNGVVFARAPRVEGPLITRVDDQNDRVLVLGEVFIPRSHWIENILGVLEAIEKNDISFTSLTLRDLKLQEWEVTLASGPTLYFDFNTIPDNLDAVLASLRNRLNLSRLTYLDFRVPNRIYYK